MFAFIEGTFEAINVYLPSENLRSIIIDKKILKLNTKFFFPKDIKYSRSLTCISSYKCK